MNIEARTKILLSVADGSMSTEAAASVLEASTEQVAEWLEHHAMAREFVRHEASEFTRSLAEREAALMTREQDERRRSTARRRGLRTVATSTAAAMLFAGLWVTRDAVAQSCAQGTNMGGVLNVFCVGAPARAEDVNHNFTTIRDWIANKIGDPNSPNVTVNGSVTATGAVTGASVTAGGEVRGASVRSTSDAVVDRDLTARGRATFPCSGCGDGGGNWGNLTIQGRVISANNNLHLSPPGGSNVIINSDYRAAGGPPGNVGISVSGNVSAPNNHWDHNYMRGADAYRQVGEPSGGGWGRHRSACDNIAAFTCEQGFYVCGIEFWHGCGWSWYDENVRVRCCSV